jgi:hypothetical protein
MRCLICNGDRWLRRQVPHPSIPGRLVTVSRACECQIRKPQLILQILDEVDNNPK